MTALVKRGRITEEDAEGFTREAEEDARPNATAVAFAVRARAVTSSQAQEAYADVNGWDYADLGSVTVTPALRDLLSASEVRDLLAAPFSIDPENPRRVRVAVVNPSDEDALHRVRLRLPEHRIEFLYASEREVRRYADTEPTTAEPAPAPVALVPAPAAPADGGADAGPETRASLRRRAREAEGAAPAPVALVPAPARPRAVAPRRLSGEGESASSILSGLVARAVADRASDIHLEPEEDHLRVRFRIDDILKVVEHYPAARVPEIISRLKIVSELDVSNHFTSQSGRMAQEVDGRSVDLRVEVVVTSFGEGATIRVLDSRGAPESVDGLGFSPENERAYRAALSRTDGVIVVTGPTGSGKTASLYASLAELLSDETKIVTIENPIERSLTGVTQMQVNDTQGMTFANSLRSVLRQDPNVILLGEIRDEETARIAVQAAQTGHVVLTTLHTIDAASAAQRLVDLGVPRFLVASTLRCVMAQRLCRKLCEVCRESVPLEAAALEALGVDPASEDLPETVYAASPGGCEACNGTGYLGRMALHEVMPVSRGMARVITKSDDAEAEIRESALAAGMTTLRTDGWRKVRAGVTSVDEVLRVANTGDEL